MKIEGKVFKSKKFWLAEVSMLDLLVQGKTRKEALLNVSDASELLANERGFKMKVEDLGEDCFSVTGNNESALISLILRRQREAQGLSIAEVAAKLGAKSRNGYARYETGKVKVGLAKFLDLFKAITQHEIMLNIFSWR